MSSSSKSSDVALLARLNALKKSSIHLDTPKSSYEASTIKDLPVDPAPAKALHSDLLNRFKTLTGQSKSTSSSPLETKENYVELSSDEDGKTVEDLLAELGPEDSWDVPKDEEAQIQELLTAATSALKVSERSTKDETGQYSQPQSATSQAGVVVSSNAIHEHRSPPHEPDLTEAELDREADDYLSQILDEIKHESQQDLTHTNSDPTREVYTTETNHIGTSTSSGNTMDLPKAPLSVLDLPPSYSEAMIDDDLASRFANLGLPSVPTTIKSPTTTITKQQTSHGYADEEINSWCIICNENATLRCIGCDGDLYCTSCWLEGHKGEDAGYEERKHKAVQYDKKSGLKKQSQKKTLIGA